MFLLCLNFHETFFQLYFYRTPMGDCFWKLSNVGAHARLFIILATFRSSRGEVQNSQESTCVREKYLCQSLFQKVQGKACNFIQKKTLVQVFSCEFLQNTSSGCF